MTGAAHLIQIFLVKKSDSCGLPGSLLSWYQEISPGKYESTTLFQKFRHFYFNENPTRALNTTTLKCCLPSTDAIDRREKILVCVWRNMVVSSVLHWYPSGFPNKNKVGYFSKRVVFLAQGQIHLLRCRSPGLDSWQGRPETAQHREELGSCWLVTVMLVY